MQGNDINHDVTILTLSSSGGLCILPVVACVLCTVASVQYKETTVSSACYHLLVTECLSSDSEFSRLQTQYKVRVLEYSLYAVPLLFTPVLYRILTILHVLYM